MFVPLTLNEESLTLLDKIDEDRRVELVRNCVHALVVLGQRSNPIKKTDLNKLVFPTSSHHRQNGALVQEANRTLDKVFGMRLFETEDKSRYLLVNSTDDYAEFTEYTEDLCEEMAVMYLTLMEILASPDEKVSEDELLNSLKLLKIPQERLKAHFESSIKKMYLNSCKRQETRCYSWGQRALAEINPDKFFNSFLELIGNTSNNDWPDLMKRVDKLKSIANR